MPYTNAEAQAKAVLDQFPGLSAVSEIQKPPQEDVCRITAEAELINSQLDLMLRGHDELDAIIRRNEKNINPRQR